MMGSRYALSQVMEHFGGEIRVKAAGAEAVHPASPLLDELFNKIPMVAVANIIESFSILG